MTLRAALEAAHPGAVVIGDDRYAALSGGAITLMESNSKFIATRYRPTIDATVTGRTPAEALANLREMS